MSACFHRWLIHMNFFITYLVAHLEGNQALKILIAGKIYYTHTPTLYVIYVHLYNTHTHIWMYIILPLYTISISLSCHVIWKKTLNLNFTFIKAFPRVIFIFHLCNKHIIKAKFIFAKFKRFQTETLLMVI